MATSDSDNYIIEQFTLKDSHFKELADLITGAFLADEAAQDDGAVLVFTEQTFRTIFGLPSVDRRLFVRARYKPTNEIVGFLGTINKKLLLDGKQYKCGIPAWLAVSKRHQRKGLAKRMGLKMLELGQAEGYDAAFSFHESEQHGIDTSQAVAREAGIPINRLVLLDKFVIRAFDIGETAKAVKLKWYEKLYFKTKEKVGKIKSKQVRLYDPKDIDQIFDLTMDLVIKSHLSIVPEYEDMKWMLNQPNVLCVVHENKDGKINGYILVWQFILAGFGNEVPYGWLDTVHAYNLNQKEVKDLANFMSQEAIKLGWKGVQTPYIPYFDAKPFIKANFIFFGKKVGIDLFNWSNIPIPEKIESIYFILR
ncbi:MAG: GNAT family N-acetyltransferase [Candidatus Heimdallarchaeota archaeon]